VVYDANRSFAPEGRSIIAQQFTAGKINQLGDVLSPGGTIEVVIYGPISLVPPGRDNLFSPRVPSDESLGYCQPTLRVEVLANASR
jgi:hypothetical protein